MATPRAKGAPHDDIPFLTAPVFAGLPVAHGFFSRVGGVSPGYYESLNTGFKLGDDLDNVQENNRRAVEALGCDPQKRCGLMQVHSTICHIVDEKGWGHAAAPEGDAMVSATPDMVLTVLTADCAPVLFASDNVVGAAHAGWGGALNGVLESTIKTMTDLGAKDIRAAIGPCIGPASYEVSSGFEKPFLIEDSESERFFRDGKDEDHLFFDLPGYCAWRLARAGVGPVHIAGLDTLTREDAYFSHRRMTLHGEPARGLQISAISLKRP